MAGWNPDDSDLNTRCQFCHQKLVPSLTICLKPFEINEEINSARCIGGIRQKLLISKRLSTSNYSVQSVPENLTGSRKFSSTDRSRRDELTDKKSSMSAENLTRVVETSPKTPTSPTLLDNSNGHLEPKKLFDSPNLAFDQQGSTDSLFTDDQKVKNEKSAKKNELKQSEELWVSVPFLSPLVLRKELENVANQEGEDCLTRINFLHEHKILFWNLLYLFERISVPTHLKGWVKVAFALGQLENEGRRPEIRDLRQNKLDGFIGAVLGRFGCYTTADNVVIRCVYDSAKLQNEERLLYVRTPPLYELWLKRNGSQKKSHLDVISERSTPAADLTANESPVKSGLPGLTETSLVSALLIETRGISINVLNKMVDHLNSSNVHQPIHQLINEYRKSSLMSPLASAERGSSVSSLSPPKTLSRQLDQSSPLRRQHQMPRHRSLYRELLLLGMTACGEEMMRDRFDAAFLKAFVKLPPRIVSLMQPNDRAPTAVVRACRKIFMPLDVS